MDYSKTLFKKARELEQVPVNQMSEDQLQAATKNKYVTRSLKKDALLELRLRDMGLHQKKTEVTGPIAMAQRKTHEQFKRDREEAQKRRAKQ